MKDAVQDCAREAGRRVLSFYQSSLEVRHKSDGSPVSAADMAAHSYMAHRLPDILPLPVISEESFDPAARLPETYWLIDPIDGTRDFLQGTGEFTINIALVRGDKVELGCIYVPVQDVMYAAFDGVALKDGKPLAQRGKIERVRPIVVGSRFHPDACYAEKLIGFEGIEVKTVGSSLKFCMLADGQADIYLRFGKTSEWDTAAGQAICEAAGCQVIDLSTDQSLVYGKTSSMNGPFIVFPGSSMPELGA